MKAMEYIQENANPHEEEWDLQEVVRLMKGFAQLKCKQEKLIRQLFVGKVMEIIGDEKTMQLYKESKEAFNRLSPNSQNNKEQTNKGQL